MLFRPHYSFSLLLSVFLSVISLATSSTSAEEHSAVEFSKCSLKLSVKTKASQEMIWQLWADVENWKRFDTLLEYSYLEEGASFEKGATGYVKAYGAPRTRFELTFVDQGVSFVETLKLPLYHSLDLRRYFASGEKGETVFVHQVDFKGPLKGVLYYFLKDTFAEELPLVMGRLRDLAERLELEQAEDGPVATNPVPSQ